MAGIVCELTSRCNLGCAFCYNPWRKAGSEQIKSLPAAVFAGILADAAGAAGASWLTFAGGEPLLYPELENLLCDLHQRQPQLVLGLASNGTLLSRERLRLLHGHGLRYVEISLFAATGGRYHELTGKDALADAQRAMLLVKELDLPLTVACTLLADGLDELEEVMMTALALGADAIALNPFTPTGHGAARQATFGLTRQRLADFLATANRVASGMPIPVSLTLPVESCLLPHADYPQLQFGSCQCGSEKWVIDPQGDLRTCEQNECSLGNLLEHGFTELAARPEAEGFRRQYLREDCPACPDFAQCGGGCRFSGRSAAWQ